MLGRIQDGKLGMDEEMNSLQNNTTWELVSLPLGRKLVQCKWVFQTKVIVDGYWAPNMQVNYS